MICFKKQVLACLFKQRLRLKRNVEEQADCFKEYYIKKELDELDDWAEETCS